MFFASNYPDLMLARLMLSKGQSLFKLCERVRGIGPSMPAARQAYPEPIENLPVVSSCGPLHGSVLLLYLQGILSRVGSSIVEKCYVSADLWVKKSAVSVEI